MEGTGDPHNATLQAGACQDVPGAFRVMPVQPVGKFLVSDYTMGFLTTPPAATRGLCAGMKPVYLMLCLSFRLSQATRRSEE